MNNSKSLRTRATNLPNRKLAILGGVPAFAKMTFVGAPNQPSREVVLRRISEALDRNWLSNFGPLNHALSTEIRKQTGAKHAIPVANATIGLELAIRALDMTGEVIVPSFTFIASAHALQWQGITPVFCDVDPDTHCIDPDAIRRLITSRTTGIIGVHLWGTPCSVEQINSIAEECRLKVIYDAAHAFGVVHRGTSIGNFGDAEVFSFHATKFVNSLEGGAVVTNSDEVAKKVLLMANFGFTGYDQVDYVGTNGKLNEVAAAFGLSSLEDIGRIVEVNRRNYSAYCEGLQGLAGVRLYPHRSDTQPNYQYVVLEVDREQCGISRDQLLSVLHAENVIARRYFFPGCHRMAPYRSITDPDSWNLPVTERLTQSVLCLPTGSQIGMDDVALICSIIRQALAMAGDIRGAIPVTAQQKYPSLGSLDF